MYKYAVMWLIFFCSQCLEVHIIRDAAAATGETEIYWKEGLRIDIGGKDFQLRIGGQLMNDWGWQSEDEEIRSEFGRLADGVEFRRARLYNSGSIYGNTSYKLQLDFASGNAEFKDVYLSLEKLKYVGGVQIGQFKEPFSLEELTSSNYITFMERSLANAFAPGRNTGAMIGSVTTDERMTWALGLFRPTDGIGAMTGDAGYSLTGRATRLIPIKGPGRRMLHLGIALSRRNLQDRSLRFRARPEYHLSPHFLDTEAFSARHYSLLGAEAAIVLNRWSLQGEYLLAPVNRPQAAGAGPRFSGYYMEGSCFLTGESRHYDGEKGCFGRVRPDKNRGANGGIGAVQLTARYSSLDLSDKDVAGGEMGTATIGLNWHLNPNTRCMVNYVHSMAKEMGNADILGIRWQVDF